MGHTYLEYNESVYLLLSIPFVAGWIGGWLVNYLADVLPITRHFSQPACRHCNTDYAWRGYLLFQTCNTCKKGRGLRPWITQILLTAATIFLWMSPPAKLGFFIGWILLLYFSTVFIIDLEHRLILHPTSMFGAVLGLAAGWLRQGLWSTLLGGLAGFGIMFLFYLLGVVFTKLRARRMRARGETPDDEDALGAGDVILATILGLALGWPLIWFGLLLGILLGGAFSVLLVVGFLVTGQLKEKAWMVFIPYGPYFLVSAAMIIYLPHFTSALVPK